MRLLFAAGLVLALTACETPELVSVPGESAPSPGDSALPDTISFTDEADYRRQRAEVAAQLEAATTPATASRVEACRVVPTSEQACGGPASFRVYSVEASDEQRVARLAERLVEMDRVANAQFEFVSTCMAYLSPTPVLRGGQCVDPSQE